MAKVIAFQYDPHGNLVVLTDDGGVYRRTTEFAAEHAPRRTAKWEQVVAPGQKF